MNEVEKREGKRIDDYLDEKEVREARQRIGG